MPRALMVHDDTPRARLETLDESQLPERTVRVAIDYSDLNYKDAMAVTGQGKIVRDYPLVPGIDFAGTVTDSTDTRFAADDRVILTGWGVGERHWGGFAEAMRVDADWLVPCPQPLSTRQAMLFGTAGLTAMLSVMRLKEAGLGPGDGPVVVTGASGGVGSWAVSILAHEGFEVHAITGKPEQNAWLEALGAHAILPRADFEARGRPLESTQWAGAVDTVGGQILANLLAQMNYSGKVAAVGLAGDAALPTTVMPFILRGVSLLGVDSVYIPFDRRRAAWQRIAALPNALLSHMHVEEIGLEDVTDHAQAMLEGRTHGRVLIDPRR
ncbi:MDR family oxidoreductase [Chromohalobacter moromii]|uniref:Oxidoreductase n=1 Tax=Chromohalobacter moromii TaxID=2860329 RepID=A0A9X3AWW2_9GAMM|nr:MDR family oxidoreductase [Chromohalobacter moromii]MCK2045626.1 oxidoreductase [Chromohalobacter moromii]MCT8504717.1 oxidoreductase [Chromohalobacter moromii]